LIFYNFRLQIPIYIDLLFPLNIDHNNLVRIIANKNSPIGGIGGYEILEIEISPIQLQITYEMYSKLWEYFSFLNNLTKTNDIKLETPIITNSLFQNNDIENIQNLNNENIKNIESDIDIMKKRSKNIRIFNYIKIQDILLYVSFMGIFFLIQGVNEKESPNLKYFRNFEKLKINLKPITYNASTLILIYRFMDLGRIIF
jgi:hypothetical protein